MEVWDVFFSHDVAIRKTRGIILEAKFRTLLPPFLAGDFGKQRAAGWYRVKSN